jgi:hypothetical protein
MANNLNILHKVSGQASIFDIVAPASTEAGFHLVLGARNANGTYAAAANSAVTDLGMVVVLPVTLPYEVEKTENEYVIATGEVTRAYRPYVGMEISIPQANITATAALAVGKVVVPKAAVAKPECLAAPSGTEAVVWAIKELYTKAGIAMARLLCVKAV